jgi:hypothetical protein
MDSGMQASSSSSSSSTSGYEMGIPAMMHCLPQTQKHQGQVTMDWNLWN